MGALLRPLYQVFLKMLPSGARAGVNGAHKASLAFRFGSGVGHFGAGVVSGVVKSSGLGIARSWSRALNNPKVKALTAKASNVFKIKPPRSVTEMRLAMENNPEFANFMMFALPMVGVEVGSYLLGDGSKMGDVYIHEVIESEKEYFNAINDVEDIDYFINGVIELSQYAEPASLISLGTVGVLADYSASRHPTKGVVEGDKFMSRSGVLGAAGMVANGNTTVGDTNDHHFIGPRSATQLDEFNSLHGYKQAVAKGDTDSLQTDFSSPSDRAAAIDVLRFAEGFFLGKRNAIEAHKMLNTFLRMDIKDVITGYKDLNI